LFGRKSVEPFDVIVGQIRQNSSHDIMISYHDINTQDYSAAFRVIRSRKRRAQPAIPTIPHMRCHCSFERRPARRY
jgi:hypothetical protein